MILILSIFMIIFLIIICIYPIYDSYKTYTGPLNNNKSIKSSKDVQDFLEFTYNRFKKWIECNILYLISKKYLKNCYTGAVVLSQQEEARLDAATPGSLGAALVMLEQDQARQTEDYERANAALSGLEDAIINKDAAAIFGLSDEVEMDEEALALRAWITAQTGQMTHNLVNMEKCDENGNLEDYMDFGATGIDRSGHRIPSKSGKDFRWSNRCKNTSAANFVFFGQCTKPDSTIPEFDWIEENLRQGRGGEGGEEAGNQEEYNCSGSSTPGCGSLGLDVRNRGDSSVTDDLTAFKLGDFSGWTCNHYAKYFCKDGKPDFENYSDMFGMQFNWPELNCCACGGGDRGKIPSDNINLKQKYELVHNDYSASTHQEINIGVCQPEETPSSSGHLNNCIEQCNASTSCIGLKYVTINGPNDWSPNELSNYHHEHDADDSTGQNESQKIYNSGPIILINKTSPVTSEDLIGIINRNDFGEMHTTIQSGDSSTKTLKKLSIDFQNTDQETGKINSGIGITNYDLDYDKVIKNNAFENGTDGGPFNNCSELCTKLGTEWKHKDSARITNCSDDCKRSECCELNTCYNAHQASGRNDGICGPGFQRNNQYNNIICHSEGCTEVQDNTKCCEGKPIPFKFISNIDLTIDTDQYISINNSGDIHSSITTPPDRSFAIDPRVFRDTTDNGHIIFNPENINNISAREYGIFCNGDGYNHQSNNGYSTQRHGACQYTNDDPVINLSSDKTNWSISGCSYEGPELCSTNRYQLGVNNRDTSITTCRDFDADGIDSSEKCTQWYQDTGHICGFKDCSESDDFHCIDPDDWDTDSQCIVTQSRVCRLPDGRFGKSTQWTGGIGHRTGSPPAEATPPISQGCLGI